MTNGACWKSRSRLGANVEVTRALLEEIRRHLVAAYPDEGCGLLLGTEDGGGHVLVRNHVPVPNRRRSDGGARTRYVIAPEDYLAAERRAAAEGCDVLGVYHSHPDVAARPSEYDAEHAWPWYRYLIVSVGEGRVREERVYQLREDRTGFDEHDLTVRER